MNGKSLINHHANELSARALLFSGA